MTGSTRTSLLLIDSATAGCSGAYIDGLFRSIDAKASVEVGVNHYFPYAYGKKIFFKFSELTAQRRYRLGRARLYVRFLELLWAFARLLLYVRRSGIRTVCYALSSNLLAEYLFLGAVRRFGGARVYLICHDVIPFALPHEDLAAKTRRRSRFYQLADKLIVHNQNSVDDLRSTFGIAGAKIERFPFPIYDVARIGLRDVPMLIPASTTRYLFIGHLRPEKGVDVLLEGWARFYDASKDVELVVAGNIPPGCHPDVAALDHRGLRLLPNYLSDEEYVSLIKQADCVVLPYLRGTNSAVVSTVLSLRKNLIVSDIAMFRNNPLIPAESFFHSGESQSLADRMEYFRTLDGRRQLLLEADVARRFAEYERAFTHQVNAVLGSAARGAP